MFWSYLRKYLASVLSEVFEVSALYNSSVEAS